MLFEYWLAPRHFPRCGNMSGWVASPDCILERDRLKSRNVLHRPVENTMKVGGAWECLLRAAWLTEKLQSWASGLQSRRSVSVGGWEVLFRLWCRQPVCLYHVLFSLLSLHTWPKQLKGERIYFGLWFRGKRPLCGHGGWSKSWWRLAVGLVIACQIKKTGRTRSRVL